MFVFGSSIVAWAPGRKIPVFGVVFKIFHYYCCLDQSECRAGAESRRSSAMLGNKPFSCLEGKSRRVLRKKSQAGEEKLRFETMVALEQVWK